MKSRYFGFGLGVLLILQCIILWSVCTIPQSDTAVLPILTPVSLEYEKAYRSGEPPVDIHQMMDRIQQVQPTSSPENSIEVRNFISDRKQMLELRNRRHELNIELMNAGIELISMLNDDQWSLVQSQRDRVKLDKEESLMEELLLRWSQRD